MVVPGADVIASRTLANGLQIIVWPDADIPNVAWYHWVKVGSRNERPGITGISHFFEHMMFQGTAERAPGEFDRVMEANGGVNNAYTNNHVTGGGVCDIETSAVIRPLAIDIGLGFQKAGVC